MDRTNVPSLPTLEPAAMDHPVTETDNLLVIWDRQARYGGVYILAEQRWTIVGPFDDVLAFSKFVSRRLIVQRLH